MPLAPLRPRSGRLLAGIVAAALVATGLPLLAAGIATAATTQNGMTLSVDDGQTVAGTLPLTARDDEAGSPAAISVDGVALETTRTDPPVTLNFQSHGWEATTLNTFVVNGTHEIQPKTRYYDWANGSWPVPASVLRPGENTIELKIGSGTMVLDPGTNANDDFNVRSVRLTFADGTTAADPSISPATKTIGMGDGAATSLRTFTWKVTVPPAKIAPTSTAQWNADDAGPGDHVITATSADGTRTASATVRVERPAGFVERVVLTPPQDPSTSQSFTWRTESITTDGAVHLRPVGGSDWTAVEGYANEVLTSGGLSTRTHSATATGLTPATEYEYYVGGDAAISDTYRFTTASAEADPFSFIYFGDAQNELTDKWAPVVKQAYEKYPDAVGTVNAGDLIDASRNDSEWTEWFDAMDGYSQTSNVIAAPGNHEYVGDTFLKNWKSAFEYDRNGPKWNGDEGATEGEIQEAAYREQIAKSLEETAYYTDYQGVRFITLNASHDEAVALATPADLPPCATDCPDPGQLWLDMQAEWLDEILSNNPNKWTVAVFHQPVYSTAEGRDEPEIRATWGPVFQRNDIDLVLMGHDHTYARGFVNSDATATPGVTTGPVYAVSVSGPKYYEQQPANDNVWTRNGATQVKAAGHTSTFQGIRVDGNTLRYESIVAAKWDDQSTTDVPVGGTLDAFTITKYDSGAKFVTEDGVAIPEDPGTEEPEEESGIEFSIPNGATVSGFTNISASDAESDEPLSILLDGVARPVTPRTARVNIAFEGHGYLANTMNTIVINDNWTILPATAYNSYATGRFTVPAGALHPGVNKIEFYTGSTAMMNDPATDGRNDDFNIRNLRLEFGDGTTASDPGMSPTAIANLGDNGSNVRSWQWDITVPEEQLESGSTFAWDTTATASGPHTLRAVSGDGTRYEEITAHVDNYEAVTLDLADGDQLHSTRTLTATSDVEPVLTVDGAQVPLELRRRAVDPVFTFEGDGFQPDAVMDSIWVNGELYRVLGVPEAAHGFKTVQVPIPWELLNPGANTIRIRAGGNLSPTGNDADSFSTRNSRLVFSGARALTDPAYTPTQVLNYGPSVKFRDFTFTIPDRYETVYQAEWDTTGVNDGEHTVEMKRTDGRSSASATVTVDNTGPAISIGAPVEGTSYAKGSFVVDASADDALHEVATLELDIDGTAVSDGGTVSTDELPGGAHVFTARAVDSLGNETIRTVAFTTTSNLPDAATSPTPQDGATGVTTSGLQLGALVSDPAGDAIDATVKWGYRSDFAQGGSRALGGSSTTALPDLAAGTDLDAAGYDALAEADGQSATTVGDKAYPFQQFEVDVPAGLESFDVSWVGSVPETQRAVLSVWNHTTGAWQSIDEGTGANLTLSGSANAADAARDGKATVMVQDVAAAVIAEGGADAVWAWISDTQFYSQNDPSVYEKQARWVLDNKDAEGIGYAVHTGDIVNTKDENEWKVADRMHKLWDDAGLPYGMLVGNHDVDADGEYGMYQKYFGADRFEDKPWFGGTHENNVQHYDVLSTPEADYLVVFVDWLLDQDDIDWANEVIRAHPEHNVIVATHQYFGNNGAYINPAPQIWDQIVAPNPNVDVVLSGHIGIWLNQKAVGANRKVIEVMADYQSAPNNGDGWMRTITFDPAAQTFSNRTFSVTHDRTFWQNDAMENFTVPMSIEAPERSVSTDYVGVSGHSGEVVGTVEDVASGNRATVTAGDLQPDTRYAWYVESKDAEGFTTASPVWAFTTGDAADATAPALSVPAATRVVVGGSFDPMAGVTAVDAVDGDLTSAVQVTGTVDVATPGEYRLTYTVADAAGNVATVERVVMVVAEGEQWGPLEPAAETLVVQKVEGRELTVQVPTELIGQPLTWVAYSEPTVLGEFASDENGLLTLTLPEGLEAGEHRIAGHAADGSAVTWAPFQVPSAPTTGDQELEVDVPEVVDGEFVWSIDGSNGLVDLGVAEDRGDHFAASGAINPIRVTDTRRFAPEWSLSAQVSDFTGDAGTFSGKFLGWAPKVVEPGGGAVAGAPVVSGFDSGNGLSEASGLGSAPTGHERGSARLGADLSLKLPVEVGQGTYRATLTLTALS